MPIWGYAIIIAVDVVVIILGIANIVRCHKILHIATLSLKIAEMYDSLLVTKKEVQGEI